MKDNLFHNIGVFIVYVSAVSSLVINNVIYCAFCWIFKSLRGVFVMFMLGSSDSVWFLSPPIPIIPLLGWLAKVSNNGWQFLF